MNRKSRLTQRVKTLNTATPIAPAATTEFPPSMLSGGDDDASVMEIGKKMFESLLRNSPCTGQFMTSAAHSSNNKDGGALPMPKSSSWIQSTILDMNNNGTVDVIIDYFAIRLKNFITTQASTFHC